jgi:YesN/AraC family two-component response regulator
MRSKPSRNLHEIALLYVEDDDQIREALAQMVRRSVGALYIAKDGKEGAELFREHRPDIVVSDIRMPKMDGLEMARTILGMDPRARIVFTTAFG